MSGYDATVVSEGLEPVKLRQPHFILGVIIGIAALMRLFLLDEAAVWVDEGVYLHHFKGGVQNIWASVSQDGYPPLWFYLVYPFFHFGQTEFWMRFSSIPPLLGSIYMTFLIGRQLGNEKAGLFAALFLAISPYSLQYTQVFKYIPLFDFFCLIWIYSFLRFIEESDSKIRFKRGAVFALVGALCLWQHYLSFFLLFSFGLFILFKKREYLLQFILFSFSSIVMFAPWVLTMKSQTDRLLKFVGWGPLWEHLMDFPFLAFADIFRAFSVGSFMTVSQENIPILLLVCFSHLILLIASLKIARKNSWFFLILLSVPAICVWSMMMLMGWFFHPRYFSQVFPLYCVLLGSGVSVLFSINFDKKWLRSIFLVLFIPGVVLNIGAYYKALLNSPDNRDASIFIGKHFQEGDLLVVQPHYMEPIVNFYLKGQFPIQEFHHPEDYRIGVTKKMAEEFIADQKSKNVKRVWLFQGLGIRNRADQKGITFKVFKTKSKLLINKKLYAFPADQEPMGNWALFDLK